MYPGIQAQQQPYQTGPSGAPTLTVNCVEAQGLPSSMLDKLDAYAKLMAVSTQQTFQTKPHDNSGSTPRWNQTFVFNVLQGFGRIHIEVWDSNIGADGFVASGEADATRALQNGTDDIWVDLLSKSGKPAGKIHLNLVFNNPHQQQKAGQQSGPQPYLGGAPPNQQYPSPVPYGSPATGPMGGPQPFPPSPYGAAPGPPSPYANIPQAYMPPPNDPNNPLTGGDSRFAGATPPPYAPGPGYAPPPGGYDQKASYPPVTQQQPQGGYPSYPPQQPGYGQSGSGASYPPPNASYQTAPNASSMPHGACSSKIPHSGAGMGMLGTAAAIAGVATVAAGAAYAMGGVGKVGKMGKKGKKMKKMKKMKKHKFGGGGWRSDGSGNGSGSDSSGSSGSSGSDSD